MDKVTCVSCGSKVPLSDADLVGALDGDGGYVATTDCGDDPAWMCDDCDGE